MSDNVITLKQSIGDTAPRKNEKPTQINTRLLWLADLVQTLLDAESTKTRSLDT
jgi:hypothetical protein